MRTNLYVSFCQSPSVYETTQKFVKTAGSITASVLKRHFIPELERVIEDGVKIKHSTLAEKIDKLFQNPTMINPKVSFLVARFSRSKVDFA